MLYFTSKGNTRLLPLYALLLLLLCSPVVAQSTFSADRLVEAARSYLQRQTEEDAEITYTGQVKDQTFSQSGVQAEIRTSSVGSGSRQNVVFEFSYNNKVIRQVSLPFTVNRTISVPVVTMDLPAGTLLTSGHIRIEQRPLQTLREQDIVSVDDVMGQKLKSNVAASEVLTKSKLTAPDGITRGQTVRLVARSGSIVISTTAKALGDALPGESVNVMRTGAKSVIQAVAIGNGVVEVQ